MKQDRLSRTLGAQFLDPYSGFRTNAVTCPTIADTVPTTNSFWPPSLGSLAAFLRPTDRLHSESCPLCVGLCTQIELSELIGSTQRAISYYENEAGYPPTSVLIALAKALHVSTDELLGLAHRNAGPLETDPQLRRTWKRFRRVMTLPERDQRAVIRLINSLATAHQPSPE